MPTYEYECRKCGHTFETFQSMSDKPLRKCPACGKMALQRLLGTGAAVIFRGGGFYETDYRSETYKREAKKEKEAASGGEGKDSGKDSSPGKKKSGDDA